MSFMANFEKIVKVADAVCDSIPVVSTITNALHAIYKLAHKVDIHNPVSPGLKTSLKIHSLSKSNLECLVLSIPVFGNIIKLIELVRLALFYVTRPFHRCIRLDHPICKLLGQPKETSLVTAIRTNNQEIMHMCLANGHMDDPINANNALQKAAQYSSFENFELVIKKRTDWQHTSLVEALSASVNNKFEGQAKLIALKILDEFPNNLVIDLGFMQNIGLVSAISYFLKKDEMDVAEKITNHLIDQKCMLYIARNILLYDRSVPDGAPNPIKDFQSKFMSKIKEPDLRNLVLYLNDIKELIRNGATDSFRRNQQSIILKLLEKAKLSEADLVKFISLAIVIYNDSEQTDLISKYERELTSNSKVLILANLFQCTDNLKGIDENDRCSIISGLLTSWGSEFSASQKLELLNLLKVYKDCSRESSLLGQETFQKFSGLWASELSEPQLIS
jgi:hypothetical protein